MVEAELTAEGKKTKGGIIYGFDEDIQFADDNTSWEADVAQICAPVYALPDKLYYNREDPLNSIPWGCDLEIKIGDLLWYNVIESRNAVAVKCEEKAYKLIPYSDCYVVKRFHPVMNWDEVIVLNGYCLLEPIYKENKSFLAVDKKGDIDMTRGIVRFYGKPNREYIRPDYWDFQELENGDEVLLSPNTPLFYLERKKYLSSFNGDNLYWVVQRRRIAMVLSKGN